MSWIMKKLDGTELAKVLSFTPALERTKIVTRLYNGQYIAQTIGNPSAKPSVSILVDSLAGLRAVNEAEAGCAQLQIVYRERIYTGYIVDVPKWTAVVRGHVYTATVNFAVQEEEAET